jgi:hypothetical protein
MWDLLFHRFILFKHNCCALFKYEIHICVRLSCVNNTNKHTTFMFKQYELSYDIHVWTMHTTCIFPLLISFIIFCKSLILISYYNNSYFSIFSSNGIDHRILEKLATYSIDKIIGKQRKWRLVVQCNITLNWAWSTSTKTRRVNA